MLDFDRTGIDQFVSLGSPQLPPPDGVIDQARALGPRRPPAAACCPGPFCRAPVQRATAVLASSHRSHHQSRHGLLLPQTRGILTWINDAAPGAFHSDVQYVTVAGAGCTRMLRAHPQRPPRAATLCRLLRGEVCWPQSAQWPCCRAACARRPLHPRRRPAGPRHLAAARGGGGLQAGVRRRHGLGRRRGAGAVG